VTNSEKLRRIKTGIGFIAALDQSGGSTPKALDLYGISEDAYTNDEKKINEKKMFDLVHEMRTRIATSPSFTGKRILGAILFEDTTKREINGKPSARYLWDEKNIVPFLKVDNGLAVESDGVQLMKPIPELDARLELAKENGIIGTKMRSQINHANEAGVKAVVVQQFDIARRIVAADLVPIVEPEVDIDCQDKADAESLLKAEIMTELDRLQPGQLVMLKLTIPTVDDRYVDCIEHPNVLRVVALSGGYWREKANRRLARQHGMIASFSRALTEGLKVYQTDEEFDAMLDESIESICQASKT